MKTLNSSDMNPTRTLRQACRCEPALIVAMARNGAIGRGGELLYHISEDLKHFKALTLGHAVIMGRKTWESLPNGALPGRRNIVVSRNSGYQASGAEIAESVERAIEMVAEGGDERPMIIGGGEIYRQAIERVNKMYITEIDAEPEGADTYFPAIDRERWRREAMGEAVAADEESGRPGYQFICYYRK